MEQYNLIALKSNKTRILIIGGGKAAYIKLTSFLNRGCNVFLVSTNISDNIRKLIERHNVHYIEDKFHEKYIIDKHLVVIATDDEQLNCFIRKKCDDLYKLYIDCSDNRKSICFNSFQRETNTMFFSLNSKKACPNVTTFLGGKIKKQLESYDDYIEYVSNLRKNLRKHDSKNEIMDFLCSDDFYFFFKKGYGNMVLNMFYGGIDFEVNVRNQKE